MLIATGTVMAQNTVVIKGKFNGDTKGFNKVYIYGKGVKNDSTVMKDGNFEFSLAFEQPFTPLFYTEYDKSVKRMYSPFPLLIEKPGTVVLSDGDIAKGMGSFKVSGMQSAQEFNEFRELHSAVYTNVNKQLMAKYGKGWLPNNDPNAEALNKDREEMAREGVTALLTDFITKHPDSYASVLALSNYGRTGLSIDDLQKLLNKVSPKRRQTDEGKKVAGYIEGVKNSAIGKQVADFTLNTAEEKPINFNSLKGKYVVVDFWASWCGPCKASFPHMKEVYKKYRSDKFEIYSISIDENKDAWLKGVKEQQLPWLSTLDTKNISQSGFAITAVPTTYLIDPDGKILMKEVGFDASGNGALEKKIVELFGVR